MISGEPVAAVPVSGPRGSPIWARGLLGKDHRRSGDQSDQHRQTEHYLEGPEAPTEDTFQQANDDEEVPLAASVISPH